MKNIDYRYLILVLICIVTIPISIILFVKNPVLKNPALTINKKKISKEELKSKLSVHSPESSYRDLINSLVVKEVLIQEAVKAGINREKDFIGTMKNYYEQSLIKILLDRKYSELKPEVSMELIKRYRSMYNKKIRFSVITYISYDDYKKGIIHQEQKSVYLFSSLSTFVKYNILLLKTGESSNPFPSSAPTGGMENQYMVFRLDGIDKGIPDYAEVQETAMISELLTEQKKEVLLTEWIESLKRKAEVNLSPALRPEVK